jgi:hypothetical protein
MLLKGILSKKNNKWIVIEGEDYWYPHTEHNLWLLIHGNEDDDVCFTLDDNEYAILKACGPDTREYIQD